MAKLEDLQKDIEALKKAINNPNNTNPQAKASMEGVLAKLEKQAKELAGSSPAGKTYKDELARQRATGEAVGEGISLSAMSKAIDMNKSKPAKKTISLNDFAKQTGIEITHMTPKTEPKTEKKKSVPVPKADQDKPDYDCDDLIAKAEARRLKAKERAKAPEKTEATKNKEKLEKVFDNVKDRAENEDISKTELTKLIEKTEALLKMLKSKLASL
jgi:hypothetical protein